MRLRCLNPNSINYADYGGRGITICERWNSFSNFLYDMGKRPKGKTLDRKNVYGNYSPSNCRWATYSEQVSNRRKLRVIENFADKEILQEYTRRFKNGK